MSSPRFISIGMIVSIALCIACAAALAETSPAPRWPSMEPAQHLTNVAGVPLLSAARAGNRVIAVGDHGVILLSDDGKKYRQAKTVPVRSMLTSVQFLNPHQGYAAGHDGVVLGTDDGGDTWKLLRAAPGAEQPILSLYFESLEHGIGVGLYGRAIETRDAGRTWTELRVGSGEDADRHLFHIFASSQGTLFIAGEAGTIFRSTDRGKSWQTQTIGNKGSLWYGRSLADGTLLICGMRGHLYRSSDNGKTWVAVPSNTTQSLTGIAVLADGSVVVAGLDGTVLRSTDNGATFTLTERAGREPLTAVLAYGPRPVLISMTGPLTEEGRAAR